ncbi:BspA family leucine-rich repeat surface protein [Aliikangiella sp. IMCC44359]|uniref:BspA family leucine-rich repeat surface protein n=1 Tax=Aliikangiella sp. IMCC44359 TaxID=3459125 RepID=UPI00403B300B
MKYLSKALSSLSAVLFLSLTIIACGGGGGNSTPLEPSDSTPDSFTFVEVTEAELSSVVESESITITGIDTATSVSISGGEYSIDGGSFISSSGSVTNGQSVIVRQTVSSEHSTTTDTVLTIGGVSGTFRVTTLAADTSPDIVFFNVRNNVEPNMPIESNDITVSGISVPVAISINNGEYAIDGGIYTSDAGMIENGQSVVVRLTASSELETTTSAILSIGDIESAFEVTTKGRFNFEGFTGVALNARLQTRIVAINNIGDQTPISIENGEYQLDRGAWTDQDGFIDNDQEVRVRTHSGDDYNVTTAAKLNIGESWGYFEITTKEHGDFISVWQTQIDPPSGSHNDQITLPLEANGTYNFTVEWGDGTSDIITQWDQVEVTHTYPQAGEYTVTIRGEIIGFSFNNSGDKEKLLEIQHWGDLRLGNSGGYFAGAKYLNISAEDALDLEGTTSLEYLFYITENVQGNISNWDVSSVTDMSWMFRYASGFNGDISQWDVSSVVNMNVMFSNAFVFNGDISQWDVSSVTAMNNMFAVALAFNGDLSQWGVSSVKEMGAMFYSAPVFNSDISQWDVSSVTDMSYMFSVAKAFNGDLSQWDVSSVTKMSYMFEAASVFNSDLSQWNVSSVTDMSNMFNNSGLSTENYSTALNAWSQLTGLQENVPLGAFGVRYYASASNARNFLINDKGWSITDAGEEPAR